MRFAVFVVLALLASGQAIACICDDPTAADEALVAEEADVVFVGEVKDVSVVVVGGFEEVRATFKVLNLKKGPKAAFITILVRHGGTSCDLVRADFKIGERYLLSGSRIVSSSSKSKQSTGVRATKKLYYNNYCDLRERLD